MLTSTESIGTPGSSAKEEMQMQIELQQRQPQHTIIFVEGNGPKPVPKLKEPTCCCGCDIKTASIIAMIWQILTIQYLMQNPNLLEKTHYVPLIINGGMALCYAGIAFCRTEQLCSIVSAVNHLFSIPNYLIALILFYCAYMLPYLAENEKEKLLQEHVKETKETVTIDILINAYQIFYLFMGVLCILTGCLYTYMANKYQEFGEYLNKESKQSNIYN